MRKVCHVTSVHRRYDTRIFQKECRTLASAGYEVTLLVNDDMETERRDNVTIISTGFVPKNRAERFFKLKSRMFQFMLDINAEIYQFHDPDLMPLAIKLKNKKKNIKIIFDSHEDIPAQILGKQWIPHIFRGIVSKMFSFYERTVLKKFDYVIGVTPVQVEKLKKIKEKTEMITNFPIIPDGVTDIENDYTKRYSIICFAGGVDQQWCHEEILNAIDDVDVKYELCGPTSDDYIELLKKMPAWEKVNYLGRVPFETVNEVYQKARIGVALLDYSPNTGGKQGTLGNTKLFEFMLAGLPIICTDFVLWKEIVEKYECGICVNPHDVVAIKKAIEKLLGNVELAKDMGHKGRCAVMEIYNWGTQAEKLIGVYKECLSL